ncbi:MAG: hypothetical protein ACI4JX_01735, partial [Oscillospiraceae bacterium]
MDEFNNNQPLNGTVNPTIPQPQNQNFQPPAMPTKFCKHCGGKIAEKAVICPLCGCQVEQFYQNANYAQPNIIINNANTNMNTAMAAGRLKNKWTAILLCLFLGVFGGHK